MKHIYLRDGRSPIPEKENTSKVMSANRAKNTNPELSLRHALWKEGIRGYRLNWTKAPGRPDIVFLGKKIAVFVHGCFWHRCPHCHPSFPKSHKEFWENKFSENITRDLLKVQELRQAGWRVLTIWECEVKYKLNLPVTRVKKLLNRGVNG